MVHAMRGLRGDVPEALHHFRVAVRRLRTLLSAFRDPLDDVVSPRVRRTLRAMAHATNASRDADVHAAWIAAQRETLRLSERKGANWLLARVERAGSKADRALDTVLTRDVQKQMHRLRERLRDAAEYDLTLHAPPDGTFTPFGVIARRQIHWLADDLARAFRAIHAPEQHDALHVARIAVKHLRSAIEPFADETVTPQAPIFVAKLVQLQDDLGALRDVVVITSQIAALLRPASRAGAKKIAAVVRTHLASDSPTFHRALAEAVLRDPVPGLTALVERLRSQYETSYASVQHGWLDNMAAALAPAYDIGAMLEAMGNAGTAHSVA
jgi:CHAD domain-containing protein